MRGPVATTRKIGWIAGAIGSVLALFFLVFPEVKPRVDAPPRTFRSALDPIRTDPGAPREVWETNIVTQRLGDENEFGPARCVGAGPFDLSKVQARGTT